MSLPTCPKVAVPNSEPAETGRAKTPTVSPAVVVRDRLQPPSLLWRLNRVARELDISRRALERERAAGRFPSPDKVVGRMPLWRPETIRAWIEGGGR